MAVYYRCIRLRCVARMFCGVFLLTSYLSDALGTRMSHDGTGIIGRNGTSLVCTFTRLKAEIILQLSFKAYGVPIMTMYPPSPPVLAAYGKYLEGRVILGDITITETNTTHVTSEIRLIFTDLQCIDNKTYTCEIGYSNSKNIFTKNESNPINLAVKVVPVRPSNIYISGDNNFFVEGDYITISCIGEVGYPPENITLEKILTDGSKNILNLKVVQKNADTGNCSFSINSSSTIQLVAEDNGAIFRCSATPFITQVGTFIETDPINVQYSVRMPIIWMNPMKWTDPPVTIACFGSGNPKPDYKWYRHLASNQVLKFKLYSNNQNITLSSIQDSGIYRCDVSNIVVQELFTKSKSVSIFFKDMPPLITKVPLNKVYAVGTPTIELTCLSMTHLNSTYRWILSNSSVVTDNPVVINNVQKKDAGIYTCVIATVINAELSILTVADKVIIDDATSDTQTTCNCVPAIVGSSFGVLGVCFVILIVIYIGQTRSKRSVKGRQMMMNTLDQLGSSNYEGVNGQRTDHHYDELQHKYDHQYDNTNIQ